jgi:hypothetical protein
MEGIILSGISNQIIINSPLRDMKNWMKEKMTVGEYMVFVQDFLNDTVDDCTKKENEFRVKMLNDLFDYILKYNREGVGRKIVALQNKMNKYEKEL